MQFNEKNKEKNIPAKKRFSLRALGDMLKDKDEVEVRSRLRICVDFLLTTAISYMLCGAKLLFSAYPLCIALLCVGRRWLLPISIGIFISILQGTLPEIYIFTCLSTPLIRILTLYLPLVWDEMRESDKDTPRLEMGALIEYNPSLPDRVFQEHSGTLKKSGERAVHTMQEIFDETLSLRMTSASISGLICGIFLLIGSNFSFYSLWATFFLAAACPASLFLIDEYFKKAEKSSIRAFISFCAIGAGCVYVASSMTVIGMPMSPFLAMLLTLYASAAYGIVQGGISAILLGLVLDPVYMPLLLICALLFFLISTVRRNAGLAVVCAAVVVWCYYIGGTHGLVGMLPPMLLAIPIYMICDKYREIMCAPYQGNGVMAGGIYFAEAVTEKNKNLAVRERLCALSEIFSALSDTFCKLSDKRRRPDALGLKSICEAQFERTCENCRNRELCYGAEYSSTLDTLGHITSALHTKGAAAKDDLDPHFIGRCIYCDRLLDGINRSVATATESMIKNDKLGLFASSYEDINELLQDALQSDGEEYKSDRESADKVFSCLYEQGFRVGGVVVYGKRCKHIVIKGIPSADKLSAKRTDALRREVGEIVNSELGEPVFEMGSDGAVMRLSSKPLFRAVCSHGNIAAPSSEPSLDRSALDFDAPSPSDGDSVCGDTSNCFVTSSSYFYSLISDGMGSGEEAAFISGVCSMFAEKMLSAGNRADITVRMLNNVLRNENMGSGGECSATVDLCELDLISGSASFIKSGAAPTYIARGGTVYKVYSRTMPIGILKDTDTKISKFDTKKGDIIIMMSDGCCPDSEDCPWLVEFLCEYMSKKEQNALGTSDECEALKTKLLSLAVKNFPKEKDRDDISVSVIIIE